MVKNKDGGGNRKWWFLLGGVGVVILGLVIGIVGIVVNQKDSNDDVRQSDVGVNNGLQALIVNDNILSKLSGDENYSIDDAIAEYEKETSVGDVRKRVYLLFDYADFIFDEYGDIDVAISILERAEPLLNGISMTTDYYIVMGEMYRRAGNMEQAEFYEQKVLEMTPAIGPVSERKSFETQGKEIVAG